MFKSIRYLRLPLILILLSSCQSPKVLEESNSNNLQELDKKIKPKDKQKMELRISCGEGDLEEFLEDGWEITKEYSEEIICSWKSLPANENCDIEEDKGCKITKPDKMGQETFYLLEK